MAVASDKRAPEAAVEAADRVRLEIGGMTCASCAARVERKLNKLDGVEASVNLPPRPRRSPSTRRVSPSAI